ncbi:MAG: sulfate transporter [Candidatus Dactylopiibacterium carminicum]|uniref:STAS domain-containing protein n=2 Tax=Candidatus Dactylopiibacterium carminicum TaxID=857335 RepID=A0A272EQQ7_9RHOO|nr:STAS domain-containing protein [Candidatus Dactylopiibacterium carminicum]PAS92406.1 MAG: sulfate transporter [Candidatus Dactylopiibacterium carminicum]PAS96001.1 MAG: sulfate transporter [Candidatus Dactylopiibacterium carminicum]
MGALAAAAGKILVAEELAEDVAVIEEAAVLFANANDGAAQAVLDEAVEGAGRGSEQLWRMLFDLLRVTGDKAAFDSRSVRYAQLFEKSPPVWDQAEPAQAGSAPREAAPAVNLSGNLSGNARSQFEQLVRIGAKLGKLRVDLSRLRGIDDAGASLFSETLQSLRQGKVKVAILGAEHALRLIEPMLKVGEPEGRPFWLCALAMLQQIGDEARFEDMAVNFAVTFEESPSSWEPQQDAVSLTDSSSLPLRHEDVPAPVRKGFVMEGVVGGAQPEVLRALSAYASEHQQIEIDASQLKRLEFVSAGALFNQLAQLQSQGKQTMIRAPNEMVAALMRVMGIDQVARIEARKF